MTEEMKELLRKSFKQLLNVISVINCMIKKSHGNRSLSCDR